MRCSPLIVFSNFFLSPTVTYNSSLGILLSSVNDCIRRQKLYSSAVDESEDTSFLVSYRYVSNGRLDQTDFHSEKWTQLKIKL